MPLNMIIMTCAFALAVIFLLWGELALFDEVDGRRRRKWLLGCAMICGIIAIGIIVDEVIICR